MYRETGGVFGLVANEQHLMLFVTEYAHEIIDHPTPGDHAARGNDERRAVDGAR